MTATYCRKCGGTGHAANNKFCDCTDGKLLKVMASAREKTIQAEREAEAIKKADALKRKALEAAIDKRAKKIMAESDVDLEKMVEENLKGCQFNIGDWVKVDEIIGTIANIDGAAKQIKFIGHHVAKDKTPYTGYGWIGFNKVEPVPLEQFDDVSLPMLFVQLEHELNINYALDTGNKELFMELTDSD
jgi:hypothetical protein